MFNFLNQTVGAFFADMPPRSSDSPGLSDTLAGGGRAVAFSLDGHHLASGVSVYDATPLSEKP